jgi:hypothetical protein
MAQGLQVRGKGGRYRGGKVRGGDPGTIRRAILPAQKRRYYEDQRYEDQRESDEQTPATSPGHCDHLETNVCSKESGKPTPS